jgi:hypothetical protein
MFADSSLAEYLFSDQAHQTIPIKTDNPIPLANADKYAAIVCIISLRLS